MAKVHILNVTVHNNPAPFFTPFQFEIHFECLEELQDDLEFKIIYVGSAETYEFDQTLDQIVVDAVPQGQFKFMFQADPPDTSKIPADDAVGVTVVLITASYREQEFVRVGYYVTNEYEDMEMRENPPVEPQFDKLIRTIAANEPRVTKFKINWDSANAATNAAINEASGQSTSATNNAAASVDNVNSEMMDTAAVSSANANNENSLTSSTANQISANQNDLPNQVEMPNFENKENISMQQQQQQQQQKTFVNPNDLTNGSNQVNSQQFIETSYDSIMN